MLLILILILVLIWSAVVWSIYSNFLVFYSNFSESENYHRAYYTAISALERWELVVKQRSPWYVWSWGFILGNWTWSISDWWLDWSLSDFSYLSENTDHSTIFWTVNSKTTRIPKEWEWNVEWTLAAADSIDYNMMNYENAENFLLYYDESEGSPYEKISCPDWCLQSKPNKITWLIRLPEKLKSNFWNLNTDKALVWLINQVPKDDAIVDRQIKWIDKIDGSPYTIYSTQTVAGSTIQRRDDTAIRESDVNNNGLTLSFFTNRSPIGNPGLNSHGTKEPITIIGKNEETLKGQSDKFKRIFRNTNNKQLRFSLLNLLKSTTNKIYPFLEYYIDFWTDVADRYYTINAEWNYKDYQLNIIIQKPTVKETILSNFTSIF